MAAIIRARATRFLGPEFNSFLFAPIGADRNGTNLSVVSALARCDLDPWAEAEKLTKLPEEIAIQKLSALISSLPEVPLTSQEPGRTAARLIALLPEHGQTKTSSRNSIAGVNSMTKSPPDWPTFLIIMAIILGIQILAYTYQHTAQAVNTQVISSEGSPLPIPSVKGHKLN